MWQIFKKFERKKGYSHSPKKNHDKMEGGSVTFNKKISLGIPVLSIVKHQHTEKPLNVAPNSKIDRYYLTGNYRRKILSEGFAFCYGSWKSKRIVYFSAS